MQRMARIKSSRTSSPATQQPDWLSARATFVQARLPRTPLTWNPLRNSHPSSLLLLFLTSFSSFGDEPTSLIEAERRAERNLPLAPPHMRSRRSSTPAMRKIEIKDNCSISVQMTSPTADREGASCPHPACSATQATPFLFLLPPPLFLCSSLLQRAFETGRRFRAFVTRPGLHWPTPSSVRGSHFASQHAMRDPQVGPSAGLRGEAGDDPGAKGERHSPPAAARRARPTEKGNRNGCCRE